MRRTHLILTGCLAAFAVIGPPLAAQQPARELPSEILQYADIVMHNGSVLTMDKPTTDFTVAQAVAIRDGKILAVGTNDRILSMAGPKTRTIDLAGKAVMPGVVDTHSHPNRYALQHYQAEFVPRYLKWLQDNRIRTGSIRWDDGKEKAMAQLAAVVARAKPGDMIYANSRGNPVVMNQVHRRDLDAIAPNHPVFIGIGNEMWGLVNSIMLEKVTSQYGKDLPGIIKGEDGEPTGLLFGTAGSVVGYELLPQVPAELLAPVFAKELEEWASIGVTTLSSRFKGAEISAYSLLARENNLPIRIAYTHELARWNPFFERDMKRLGNLQNYGIDDRIWLMGLSVGIPDGSPPGGGGAAGGDVCSTLKKRERFPDDSFYEENGFCYWEQPGDPTKDTIMTANRYGYRIAGVHTFGDKGLEIMMDTYKQAAADQKPSAAPAADHGLMISPTVIRKTLDAGAIWSLQVPMFWGPRTSIVSRVFGEEIAHKWSMPVKSLMEAGVKVSMGADTHDDSRAPMHSLQVLVTRETNDGRVWGAAEKIDRRRALLMFTRHGAEYVLREDRIGSIEPGKLADVIILDKNPLDPNVPDDKLKDIKVLETFVGGRVAWDAASGKTFPPSPRRGDEGS